MEELQKTQEYPLEQERRQSEQPYQGPERRKRANWASTVLGPDGGELPVSLADGTGRIIKSPD